MPEPLTILKVRHYKVVELHIKENCALPLETFLRVALALFAKRVTEDDEE